MKTRISFLILICFAFILPSEAQKYLNVYQDNVVIKRIPSSGIDSISVTSSEPHIVEMWHNGSVFQTYYAEEIDSIKVTRYDEPLSYIGIVGFNDELFEKEIGVLATSTAGQYKSFVNSLPQKDGTLLYYAVDDALDMLEAYNFKTPIKSVNFITFTDGLDLGSTMMNSSYWTSNDYLNAMCSRIRGTQIEGLPINAYTVGLRGRDVTDVEMFKRNLVRLASNEDNAFEVNSIYELRERLQDIANRIISITNRQTVSVKVPGIDNGSRMRFVFDDWSEDDQFYIEGTFSMADRSLHDVTYHGMSARSGSVVQGTQDGIFLNFTFRGLQRLDGNGLIPMNNIKHYYRLPTSDSWQINSEFRPDNNTQRTVTYTGTSIFLVLDCSSSLGSDISRMKNYACEFIDMVAGNALPVSMEKPENVTAHIAESGGKLVVQLNWDRVRFAESYDIYRSNRSSNGFTLIASDVTALTYTDINPLDGGNYYQIVAKGHGLTGSRSANAYIDVSLEVPQNVRAALDNTRFVINVSWNPVRYADSYIVYRNGSQVADGITATHWTDESPRAGINYYYIKAVGNGLVSAQSESSVSVNYALESPQNMQAALDDNDFVVNVTWNAVKYAKFYRVYRSSRTSSSYFSMVADSVYATSWQDVSPLKGDNYYRVYAVCNGVSSPDGDMSSVVKCELSAPQNVSAALDDNDFVINVSWDAVKYAESYTVYRNGSQVAEGITTTRWTDESPRSGSNYYSVKAVGHGITSNSSSNTESVNYTLAAPQNVVVGMDDDEFVIKVSWDAVKYAEGYKIYRSSSYGSGYTLVADSVKTTSWKDGSPLSGNNYYRIYAVGHGQTSSYTTSSVVKLTMPTPKNVIAVKGDGQFTVNVTWDAIKYAEYYKVYRSNTATGTFTMVEDNVTTNAWTDESTGYGPRYFKVCAVGYGYTSEMSAASNVVNCNVIETKEVENGIKVVLNGVQFTMVKVEAGTFQMGSTSGESDEKPVHQVTLTNDYYIGETEVTQELWKAVMGSNPSYNKSSDQLPVEKVSWNDCQTFITKLNELTGKNFRLPTEAEWEFAARGGNATRGYTYSGSNTIGDVAWYTSNSGSKTHEVVTKAPNELGIYDMSGNVWEWCQDWKDSYISEAQTDPTGPTSGSIRVTRGGGWNNDDDRCRVARRGRGDPLATGYNVGLRLVME